MNQQIDEQLLFRLWAKDPALFAHAPMLDWLDEPQNMKTALPSLEKVVAAAAKFSSIVLLGMGGSSASVKMFKHIFAPNASFFILDSIHPHEVLEIEKAIDIDKTLFIVASKSGSTMEPWLLYQHFLNKLSGSKDPYGHFLAITDPISSLEQESVEKGFLHAPLGKPGIGGRYSGLSVFGILPAMLMGIDVKPILDSAIFMAKNVGFSIPAKNNPAVSLAAIIASFDQGNFFIYLSPTLKPMAQWLEQLIAESLGKDGHGMVPIITENFEIAHIAMAIDQEPVPDSSFNIVVSDISELGGLMFCWQMAVALAGIMLNIDPFDQPDVERSKVLTKEIIAKLKQGQKIDEEKPDVENGLSFYGQANFLADITPESYCAILSYLPEDKTPELLKLKKDLAPYFEDAVMLEQGPCYLHSTGQLFKGGANHGHFLLLTGNYSEDFFNAEGDLSMAQIHLSEALGDLEALKERGRKVIRIHVKDVGKLDSEKIMGELCKSH